MSETSEFTGGQSSSVELVKSDEEFGLQCSNSSAMASSLLNRLHCSKLLELSCKKKVNCSPPRGKKANEDKE